MRKIVVLISIVSLFVCLGLSANGDIEKKTYIYSVKGIDTLRMDKYDIVSTEIKPCIIFMFGGGFSSGTRDAERYIDYFEKLVKNGYSVVSIDYRLGMKAIKGTPTDQNIDPLRFAALLKNSITMATEDLFDATSFILSHSDEWHINKNLIIANGSSAGAISVLHGEYAICNNEKIADKLPVGFNYAGIISFAGAIFSTNGDLTYKQLPAPIQMFHGDADRNVPYNKLELSNIGFYGSKHISEQLSKINSPYYFYDVDGANHGIADSPMQNNLHEILSFIDQFVIKKSPLIIHSKVQQIGKSTVKKDFNIMDYINENFK